ncbi:hypothetical protein MSAN_02274200 [Mycena sanguinolenta]|uniref:Uncharacterized protein n=1 Tax=Mycena sanguinolenta TaxID=230812 RepID=A0A8H6X9N9_9AGAR|nr:hypothetical protein MSAN_02274200 [Mycena sanguinolenta]
MWLWNKPGSRASSGRRRVVEGQNQHSASLIRCTATAPSLSSTLRGASVGPMAGHRPFGSLGIRIQRRERMIGYTKTTRGAGSGGGEWATEDDRNEEGQNTELTPRGLAMLDECSTPHLLNICAVRHRLLARDDRGGAQRGITRHLHGNGLQAYAAKSSYAMYSKKRWSPNSK